MKEVLEQTEGIKNIPENDNKTSNSVRTFVFLNDCVLGENTDWEIFFAYLKQQPWKTYLSSKNKKELMCNHSHLINFNNLFLRKEVVEWIKQNTHKEDIIYIVSNLPEVPFAVLELERECKLISYQEYSKEKIEENNTQIVTGEFWPNYKNFFKCKKVLFVGPYLLGKIVDSLTVGRTDVINNPYGVFSIIWDYFVNFFVTLEVLWPLLFFLPSTNFTLWVRVFMFSSVIGGIAVLWRTLLELESERKYLVNNKEVLFGGNFLYIHHSTSIAVYTSLVILLLVTFYGTTSLVNFKAMLYAYGYGLMQFLFLTRTFKEKVIAKFFTLLILTIAIQNNVIVELIQLFTKS